MTNQQLAPPPSFGYRAYSELIKQRLIYGRFYAGWSIRQGRYDFQIMYNDHDEGMYHSRREPIGYEMVSRMTNREWVIRVYLDGTALYRPHKMGWLRHPTMRSINLVLDYFFYKEAEIREDTYGRIHILRRKPLNPQFVAPVSKGFGEFLTSKYNHGGA